MRNLTSEMAAEVAGRNMRPVMLMEAFFDSGTLRLWSGYGELEYNGDTYTGSGNLIGISPIDETQNLEAKGIVVSMSGISSNLISIALTERTRGRSLKLYLGMVEVDSYVATEVDTGRVMLEDESGFVKLESGVIASPYRIYSGLMDVIEFTDDGKTADLRLSVENILMIGRRAKVLRYTNEEQRKIYPDDKGLEFVNQLQDKEIVW